MKNKKILLILAPLILISAVLGYQYLQNKSHRVPNTIRVSGNIETTVTEVSFKIAGRVEARLVDEGVMVKAGEVVARLDSIELTQEVARHRAEVQAAEAALAELNAGSRPEDIRQAEAAVQRTQARLDELLAGSRPQEIAAAEAAVRGAKAETARLKIERERYQRLLETGDTSIQQYDLVRTASEMAETRQQEAEARLKLVREGPRPEQIEQARASLVESKERLALVRKGPRQETIAQARARLQQTREVLAQSETRLSYTTVSSPLAGVVLSKSIEAGEHVAPGTPIVSIGDLKNVWLRAYINETDLGRVKVGQRVKVTADTWPGKVYEGHVSFIASEAEFTPKNIQTEKERVKLVYRIKIDMDNPRMELKPGMPADAELLLDQL